MELVKRNDSFYFVGRNPQKFTIINNKLILDFVSRRRIPEDITNKAAGNGLFGLVKYLNNKGLEVGQDGIDLAANNGHIEMVKYLVKEFGIKVDEDVINWAAGNNHMEMVKYLTKEFGLKLNIPENMKIIFNNFYYP